jgi:branched-chain amino acid transport system ATP-binding protein
MLEIQNLSAGYGMLPVLNDVSLRVNAGEFAAIVGPNGAGKTTLFKTISGIVRPTSGIIRFEGRDLLAVAPAARAHLGIAHIPEGRQVFPSLTVLENLEMGAYTETGRRAWKENLARIHSAFPVLLQRAKSHAGALSGGQQQMLAIARGLASSPKLLMLDEPSMGLASDGRPMKFSSALFRSMRNPDLPCCSSSSGWPKRCTMPIAAMCWKRGVSCWKAAMRN